jgi:hypothetical protein
MSNIIIKGYTVDGEGKLLSGVKVNITSTPGTRTPPTYKVSDGSIISFEKSSTNQINSVLISPTGLTQKSVPSLTTNYEKLAENAIETYAKSINIKPDTLTYAQTTPGDEFKDIDKSTRSNNKGEWDFSFPSTDINPKEIKLVFSKNKYELKNIKNPAVTSIDEDNNSIIDIARISMPIVPDIGNKETSRVIREINDAESKEISNAVPFTAEGKIANIINRQKEDLKRTLIPFVLKLLIPFGMSAVQALLAGLPMTDIQKLINCPTQSEIQKLLNKRNKLVKQINKLYKVVTTLTKALKIANIALIAIEVGLLAVAFIPPPIPGAVPVAVDTISKLLEKAGVIVSGLTIAAAAFGIFLGIILNILNKLDVLLQNCSEENAKTQAQKEVLDSGVKPTDPQYASLVSDKTNELQNLYLEQINSELNALASPLINANQQKDENPSNSYRGFKLELVIDQKNESKFIKRFAQALDKNNVAVLRTESSFASDPQVLLDQLKFIIDSNPNLTAE